MTRISFGRMLVLYISLLLSSSTSLANNSNGSSARIIDQITVNYKKSTPIEISATGINRISFFPMRVEKLIADLSSFTVNVPEYGSEVFLTSKVKPGTRINASVILASGAPIDLSLKVIESKEPKYIELDFDAMRKGNDTSREEINLMIDAMRKNKQGKYYIKKGGKQGPLIASKDYTVTQISNYQYGKINGSVLEVSNKTKDAISLNAADIAERFESMEAYASESESIPAKSKTRVFVVFKGEASC